MDTVPCRERRWVKGETERCYDEKRILMGGGRMEEVTKTDSETVDTSGAGWAIITVNH